MPAIKFDQQNKTPPPWVLAQWAARGRKEERHRKKLMGKERGCTIGDGLLLTPIFAERKRDGEITLQWLRSITTHTKQSFYPDTPFHVEHLETTLPAYS